MSCFQIAGSIFATNMGAPTLVGVAGTGANSGFAAVMFEWHVSDTKCMSFSLKY